MPLIATTIFLERPLDFSVTVILVAPFPSPCILPLVSTCAIDGFCDEYVKSCALRFFMTICAYSFCDKSISYLVLSGSKFASVPAGFFTLTVMLVFPSVSLATPSVVPFTLMAPLPVTKTVTHSLLDCHSLSLFTRIYVSSPTVSVISSGNPVATSDSFGTFPQPQIADTQKQNAMSMLIEIRFFLIYIFSLALAITQPRFLFFVLTSCAAALDKLGHNRKRTRLTVRQNIVYVLLCLFRHKRIDGT